LELPEQFWNNGSAWLYAPPLTVLEMDGSALISPFLFSADGDLQNQP